jgi:hypothetical protein
MKLQCGNEVGAGNVPLLTPEGGLTIRAAAHTELAVADRPAVPDV